MALDWISKDLSTTSPFFSTTLITSKETIKPNLPFSTTSTISPSMTPHVQTRNPSPRGTQARNQSEMPFEALCNEQPQEAKSYFTLVVMVRAKPWLQEMLRPSKDRNCALGFLVHHIHRSPSQPCLIVAPAGIHSVFPIHTKKLQMVLKYKGPHGKSVWILPVPVHRAHGKSRQFQSSKSRLLDRASVHYLVNSREAIMDS